MLFLNLIFHHYYFLLYNNVNNNNSQTLIVLFSKVSPNVLEEKLNDLLVSQNIIFDSKKAVTENKDDDGSINKKDSNDKNNEKTISINNRNDNTTVNKRKIIGNLLLKSRPLNK